MEERYINPHTDFGFKRLFGSEFNKELLISFLNALFVGKEDIKDVTYLNSEQLGERIESRRAIYFSAAEVQLLLAEFKLLGANTPKSDQEYLKRRHNLIFMYY